MPNRHIVEEIARFKPRPRRVARLLASVAATVAGLSYMIAPPVTTTSYLDASWPARAWGLFFLVGGVLGVYAWFARLLTWDRVSLTALITATSTLAIVQTLVMVDVPFSPTRLGGTAALAILLLYLVARWQDVKHDEEEADRADRAYRQEQIGGLMSHGGDDRRQ